MREATLTVKKGCFGGRGGVQARILIFTVLILRSFLASAMPADGAATDPTEQSGRIAYAPAQGLRIGNTGITLGGYANVNLTRDEGRRAELALDDLSAFVAWEVAPRVHLFSEIELEDVFELDDHGHDRGARDLTVERLYGDVLLADSLTIRIGKFLTPVGRWNLIHAQPLVWTTSRPLATTLPFDPHTTGVMGFGSVAPGGVRLTYALYGQMIDQFSRGAATQAADRSAGARVESDYGVDWVVGASYLAAEARGDWRHVLGVDGMWRHGPYEISGEAVVEDATQRRQDQWGLYLQGVYEALPRFHLVGRYEHYQRRGAWAADLLVAGCAWKPWAFLVLKAEYLAAVRRVEASPAGVKASFAVLF